MKKAVKWTFILLPIVLLSLFALKMFHFGPMAGSFHQGPPFHGNRMGHHGGPMNHVAPMLGFMILPFLTKMALIVTGWFMWRKRNGSKLVNVLGSVLFTMGVFFILPTILGIPFLLIMSYFIYKTNNQDTPSFEKIAVDSMSIQHNRQDFLDEWEKLVRREEK